MKKLKTFCLALTVSVAFISCNYKSTNETQISQDTIKTSEHHHDDLPTGIELNNGEKWEVNAEMKPYVLKGQEIVAAFIQNNGTDYAKLAKDVAEQNDHLIQSCTMQGKSHDELHKWLHPHLELVEALSQTTDATKAKELVARLQKSYQDYGVYFK